MKKQTNQTSEQFNNPRRCAAYNLRRVTRSVTSLYSGALRDADLQDTQFSLLSTLEFIGGTPISELADLMAMDRTTLTRNMSLLIKQGFIEVLSGEDKRVKIVYLTKKGKTKLVEAMPLWTDIQTRFVERLGEAKFNELLALLEEVEDMAG